MTKERNYGIDLLRLVLMFMICILHVLGQGGILASSATGTAKYSVFWFMEIFAYCAVDAFALISGYTATDKPRKYEKLVNIWFQVFFYSFIITILFVIFGQAGNLQTKEIIKNALPITFEKYWYMTAYFLLFLAIPILNNYLFKLSEKAAKKAFIIFIVLFAGIGFMCDSFKTIGGYSALWLIALYCIGLLGKKINIFDKQKSIILILVWLLCIFGTWYSYVYLNMEKFVNYISPTILLSGLIMVVLFKRIKLKGNIISKLSPLALGIYLLQLNQVIWDNVLKDSFTYVLDKEILIGVLLVLFYASLIFIAGLLVELFRSKLAKMIKLEILSKKIVNLIDCILEKVIIILR